MVKILVNCAIAVTLTACNVAPPPPSTGGVSFDAGVDSGREAGAEAGGATSATCETGVVIVTSDTQSTNIAVSNLDGTTLSGSFVSSGATKPGLELALSGDVDVPRVAPASGRLVLVDRYETNVLTWMNLADAKVIGQLPVGAGFIYMNPHDYLEVDATRAYVSRYGKNRNPGEQSFDQGGDLLIVDTKAPAIVGRIAIPEENPALQPSPDLMTWIGSEVVLTLGRWSADFTYSQVGDGRFIGISPSTNSIDWMVNVTGLNSCGRVALSPSGRVAAIACSGVEDMKTKQWNPALSDLVVYDATKAPPRETRRFGLGVKFGAALQPSIAFAGEDSIAALTYGGNATPGDTVFAVSASTGSITALGQSTTAYALGGLHCSPGCGDVCLLTDAERNKLRRWRVRNGAFMALDDVTVDTIVGLPPRDIGGLR